MNEFWIFIFVSVFAINSLDKSESVQLEETPLNPLDEIFGDGWWDNDKDEEWNKLTLEQMSISNSIGRTPNLDKLTNSTDHNPPLTESDHSDKAKNGEEINSNENIAERKRKIIDKFYAIRNEFKQKGKFSADERTQIEQKITKHLKVNRTKIYKWKKEFGLSRKVFYEKEERKHLIEKFDQMKAELKRDGFKNSYKQEIDKIVAKELGLSFMTIYRWKRKLGQIKSQHKHSDSEQKELMKRYYKIKDQNPKISDEKIAKRLKICRETLCKWKKQFKRQHFHSNSVDGHSVEVNAAANVQESETRIRKAFE